MAKTKKGLPKHLGAILAMAPAATASPAPDEGPDAASGTVMDLLKAIHSHDGKGVMDNLKALHGHFASEPSEPDGDEG